MVCPRVRHIQGRTPAVFAASSAVDNTSPIFPDHSIMCLDAVATFSPAPETELDFIEALEEHQAMVGKQVMCQCLCETVDGRKHEPGQIFQ